MATSDEEIPDWMLAKEGIDLFLNNRISDALVLFKKYPKSMEIQSSYAFVVFMDAILSMQENHPHINISTLESSAHISVVSLKGASRSCTKEDKDCFQRSNRKLLTISLAKMYLHVDKQIFTMESEHAYLQFIVLDALMSFEDDKLALATATLKEIEQFVSNTTYPKESSGNSSWRFFRPKVVTLPLSPELIKYFESQIILADNDIMVAILTFLHQDLSGYFKGGWVLRKAWKIYQRIYNEILNLYEPIIGNLVLPDEILVADLTNDKHGKMPSRPMSPKNKENSTISAIPSKKSIDNFMEDPMIKESKPQCDSKIFTTPAASTSTTQSKTPKLQFNGYKSSFPQSKSSYSISSSNKSPAKSAFPNSMKKSGSVNSALSNSGTSDYRRAFSPIFSPISDQLSYFTNAIYSTLSGSSMKLTATPEDKETIARLMGAVCFGYGLFQLGVSLLPPSLLKITNFFGLGCNRQLGLSNLMFSRLGTDYRTPLATLALLWYHTIVRPFYAVDGTNIQAPVSTANALIAETEQQYGRAALFLFFKGRVERLRSDFSSALIAFQASVDCTEQREIKLLSLHEIGWCNLLELDFSQAQNTFDVLKDMSRFSRIFYGYLCIICAGACGRLQDYHQVQEIKKDQDRGLLKGSQLESYLVRRINMFPSSEEALATLDSRYWKMYLYELLYLWNSFPSCRVENWNKIIAECESEGGEPMIGIAKLLQGSCYNLQRRNDPAIESFRKCLKEREGQPTVGLDAHVSAFAEYELAYLLIKNAETKPEGKLLLQHVQSSYKDYDFENRLNVRIHSALKTL